MRRTVYLITKEVSGESKVSFLKGFSKLGEEEWLYNILFARRYTREFQDLAYKTAKNLDAKVTEYTIETLHGDNAVESEDTFYVMSKGKQYLVGFDHYSGEPIMSHSVSQALVYKSEDDVANSKWLRRHSFTPVMIKFAPTTE